MSEPYIGDIRMFAGNFPPLGYLFCQGQVVSISDYDVLYSLIGTTYGGDGQTTFGLPDLRSRVPLHFNGTYSEGAAGGVEMVTLTAAQLPVHTHGLAASGDKTTSTDPTANVLAVSGNNMFLPDAAGGGVQLSGLSSSSAGQSAAHSNIQPYLCINFIIATDGIYPPQS